MVRLRDELAFVRRYLDIESVRFADRLRVEWDVAPDAEQAVVPSLVVQPLVENAMRHAVAATWGAGRLRIGARRSGDDLVIDVADDGPGVGAKAEENGNGRRSGKGVGASNGVGLADTRARLARLYGEHSALTLAPGENGGATASVRLPFRTSFAVDR
jgi:LytS/YehU family sensor histidine kinase